MIAAIWQWLLRKNCDLHGHYLIGVRVACGWFDMPYAGPNCKCRDCGKRWHIGMNHRGYELEETPCPPT